MTVTINATNSVTAAGNLLQLRGDTQPQIKVVNAVSAAEVDIAAVNGAAVIFSDVVSGDTAIRGLTGTLRIGQGSGASYLRLSSATAGALGDGANLAFGTTTGTQLGTATNQKLGFFAATPVVQITGPTDVLAGLVTLGLRAASSNPPLNLGTGALTSGTINASNKIFAGTDAAAAQTACGIYAGTGAPNNANGANGDIYFRSDGGALTTVYQRRVGAWAGIV